MLKRLLFMLKLENYGRQELVVGVAAVLFVVAIVDRLLCLLKVLFLN